MADSKTTKTAFAEAVKKLVCEKPFEKISIGEICDLCDMNRKSFYYHFHDKYELIIWIFDTEYATRVENSDDLWQSISALCEYFYRNKSFYEKILLVNGQNCFEEHFSALCKRRFKERIRHRLGEEFISDKNISLYSSFFVYSVCTWLTGNDGRDNAEFVRDLKRSMIFGNEVARAFAPDKEQ